MKILIITYYKDLNPGTVLQALGVKTGFLKIYPDAEIQFLRTSYKKTEKSSEQLSVRNYQLYINKYFNFIRSLKFKKITKILFNETEVSYNYFSYPEEELLAFINQFDIVSTGSDTILEKIAVLDQIGLMWGDNKRKPTQILFAASADSCVDNKCQLKLHNLLAQKVDSFNFIGIRDEITKSFLVEYLNIHEHRVNKQPDPTYLLPLNIFALKTKNIRKLLGIEKIAIFHFDRRFAFRKELAAEFKRMGYTLITPEYDPSCDISFKHLDIYEWGGLFEHCEIVFTERFHDTVFALRYQKPVFTFDWNKEKYNDEGMSKRSEILKDYDLLEHHFKITNLDDVAKVPAAVLSALEKFRPIEIHRRNEELKGIANSLLDSIESVVRKNVLENDLG